MEEETLLETGLKFFGIVNASISHEIKNRMAVINEQAGLLKDLVTLSEQGREISLERLTRLSDSLKNQVSLADVILKNMNRFAHSVDSFREQADLGQLLTLTAALAKRTADNRGVRIKLTLPNAAVSIETAPFLLMNLVWHCLGAVMASGDDVGEVVVGCEKRGRGAEVWLSSPGAGLSDDGESLPGGKELATALNADLVVGPGEKLVKIDLPENPAGA